MKDKNTEVQNKKETIIGHLSELRKRIIYGFISIIAFSLLSYEFSESIVKNMISKTPEVDFIFIAPSELFMSYLKIAIIGGLVLSLPIIVFNIWLFIKPGLDPDERKLVIRSLFIGGILFLLGAAFAYFFVLPMTLLFFTSFQIDEIQAKISFSNYLSFAITFILSFALIFEMPILMTAIVKLGLVRTATLQKHRKIAILIIFILAAILTPPDVISQTLLALPMLILFEIGLFFSKMVEKDKS